LLPENKRFERLVSSRKPFGLETTFKGQMVKGKGDILVYQNGGTSYIPRNSVTTGLHLIDKWKVYTGYAAPGTGNKDTYLECPATFVPAAMRETGMRGALNGTREEEYAGADCEPAAAG
jgi:hypothetical protein